jgi:hypothetical protein
LLPAIVACPQLPHLRRCEQQFVEAPPRRYAAIRQHHDLVGPLQDGAAVADDEARDGPGRTALVHSIPQQAFSLHI